MKPPKAKLTLPYGPMLGFLVNINKSTMLLMMGFIPLLSGCGDFALPKKVEYSSPEVQQLLKANEKAVEKRFAFTPVSPSAKILLERASNRSYDQMLHIYGKTSRTIGYRVAEDKITWLGEQETYKGPNQYTTVDGTSYEQIVLTYEIVRMATPRLNQLNIIYFGDDARLKDRRDKLSLDYVKPILKEWGFDIETIGDHTQ